MNQAQTQAATHLQLLFVCQGNTCRSAIAEALAHKKIGDIVKVSSAGLKPQPASDAAMAIETLKNLFQIDASSHVPRSMADLNLEQYDYVVAMDKHVAKHLTSITAGRLIVWNIPDPWGLDELQYKDTALRINQEVSKLAIKLKRA